MHPYRISGAVLALAALAATPAHADLTTSLTPSTIIAPGAVGFQNSNVTPGTTSTSGAITYNFLDIWTFTLANAANVATTATAISFTDALGNSLIQGIQNLQVKLVSNPASGGVSLMSWLTVTNPVPGLQQQIALIPTTPLVNGNYALEIRGSALQPASYGGSLITTVSPVPIPGAWSLMLSGMLGMGFLTLRARQGRY